jgi:hypothetical protein
MPRVRVDGLTTNDFAARARPSSEADLGQAAW